MRYSVSSYIIRSISFTVIYGVLRILYYGVPTESKISPTWLLILVSFIITAAVYFAASIVVDALIMRIQGNKKKDADQVNE